MAGIAAECRVENDVFEMEDQRNWSDASYKTYVRPLELPWPSKLKAGKEIRQRVTLTFDGEYKPRRKAAASVEDTVCRSIGAAKGKMPDMCLVIASEDLSASLSALPVLAQIAPQRLLLHFDPLAGHGMQALQGFAQLQRVCGIDAALEFALPCVKAPEAELPETASQVLQAGLALSALVVSPSVDRPSTPPGSRWPDCPPLENGYAIMLIMPVYRFWGNC
jgi:D-apionolactonase